MKINLKRMIIIGISCMFCVNITIKTYAMNGKAAVNTENIKNFMEVFFKEEMDRYNVPGAAVVVVKDGQEIYKAGFGYSDIDNDKKVNPDTTLFPACSVSKLFTATAIMQLVESNQVDINENVEKYISPYKIENKFNENITCNNLLTHSSGVDEASELDGNTTKKDLIKSQEYFFDKHKIIVETKPNTISRYCNQGYNILGYIIEKVAKESYEKYITENILEPLNMGNTSVRIYNSNMAIGYEKDNNSFIKIPLAYQYTSGSSGIISTVKDMGNFMIAQLNNGEFNGNGILNEQSIKEMQSKQFGNDDVFAGMGYGFIRSNRNGQEIIKHEGALPGYTTTMFLLPQQNLGIYVATNSLNPLPFNIEDEFLNKFYPWNNNEYSSVKPNTNKNYSKYSGIYRSYDGISKSNIMKIGLLFDKTMDMEIQDNKNGTLTLKEYTNAKVENITKLVEKEPGTFLREDGKGEFVFRFNDKDKVIYAFNDISHNAYEKIKFYDNRNLNIINLMLVSIIFLIEIVVIIFKLLKKKYSNEIKRMKNLSICNLIISILNIICFYGAVMVAVFMVYNNNISYKYLLLCLLAGIVLSTILVIVSSMYLINIIKNNRIKLNKKVIYGLIAITNLLFIFEMYYFNFVGFKI